MVVESLLVGVYSSLAEVMPTAVQRMAVSYSTSVLVSYFSKRWQDGSCDKGCNGLSV